MKNTITASIHFSFKGENHSPSITIELDQFLVGGGTMPDLCMLIAKANNHDMYSYEYEMMQAQEIIYSDAKGLITDFISDGKLDIEAFELVWNENKALEKLLVLAEEHMSITDFTQHIELKKVLLAAYQLGKKDAAPVMAAEPPLTDFM